MQDGYANPDYESYKKAKNWKGFIKANPADCAQRPKRVPSTLERAVKARETRKKRVAEGRVYKRKGLTVKELKAQVKEMGHPVTWGRNYNYRPLNKPELLRIIKGLPI
jgi:hypothetical protein